MVLFERFDKSSEKDFYQTFFRKKRCKSMSVLRRNYENKIFLALSDFDVFRSCLFGAKTDERLYEFIG